MMRKVMKKVITITMIICLMCPSNDTVASSRLSKRQLDRAEEIASICSENWKEYGVLPSVCIGQALVESTLGEHCRGYNYWGINSGRGYNYSSVREGTVAYMKVINNGYYKGAPFKTSAPEQIKRILAGGYCQPVGAYYQNFMWLYKTYNLRQYDSEILARLEDEKKPKKKVVSRSGIPQSKAYINPKVGEKGTVAIWYKDEMMFIYDIVADSTVPKDEIWISETKWNNKKVKIEINGGAKG